MLCRILSCISGPYPLDADKYPSLWLWLSKILAWYCQMSLMECGGVGHKWSLIENHWLIDQALDTSWAFFSFNLPPPFEKPFEDGLNMGVGSVKHVTQSPPGSHCRTCTLNPGFSYSTTCPDWQSTHIPKGTSEPGGERRCEPRKLLTVCWLENKWWEHSEERGNSRRARSLGAGPAELRASVACLWINMFPGRARR